MAGWGLLQGLGDGLQQVGQAKYKAHLDEQLTAAREARQEELDKRKEQRAADRKRTTVDPKLTEYEQRDGVWYEILRGGEGNELESRLAPANKVREFRQQEEDRARSLEDDLLKRREASAKAGMAENKLRDYDADRAFDMEQDRSRTAAAFARASGKDSLDAAPPSEEEVVSFLMKENKSTIDAIIKKYAADGVVSVTDAQRLVRQASRDAVDRGLNPNAHLQEALRFWERRLGVEAAKKKTSTSTESPTLSRSLAN